MIKIDDIESLLIEEDIEGFIEAGSPDDEYASEAEAIFEAISSLNEGVNSENQITSLISLIWEESFNISEKDMELRLPAIRRVAKKIF